METWAEIEGWFVACPLTPQRMLSLPSETVYKKIVQTGQLAQKLGAKILGLGAFTSVVGDGGLTIAKQLDIPVTTGDSYTVSVAMDATLNAAQLMDIDLSKSTGAIVGATGAIGKICAQLLAQHVPNLLLIGRRENALNKVTELVQQNNNTQVTGSTSLEKLTQADIIITVSSAVENIIHPQHLKSGAVICDVARPRDVSRQVVENRNDILVIEGGLVEVPGPVNFNFNFGFPPTIALACMAETMILTLERRFESFSLGKDLTLEKVKEIGQMAKKHGFKLGGFRCFEKPVTRADIEKIKQNVRL